MRLKRRHVAAASFGTAGGRGMAEPEDPLSCPDCGAEVPHFSASRHVSWQQWRDIPSVVLLPRHLRRTIATALAVGSVLFCINQLNVVLAGHATAVVWFKSGVTYLVPFTVSNIGVLIATRAPKQVNR